MLMKGEREGRRERREGRQEGRREGRREGETQNRTVISKEEGRKREKRGIYNVKGYEVVVCSHLTWMI